jgi:hypothetical protein
MALLAFTATVACLAGAAGPVQERQAGAKHGPPEVRVRLEPQLPRVPDRAVDDLAGLESFPRHGKASTLL